MKTSSDFQSPEPGVCITLQGKWVIPEKIPHLPDGWDSGNSQRRGGQRLWKSRREGGGGLLNLRKSSAGVISTDSSRDSNV